MDSVRFGRVLGVGARLAGKTLVQAVDAATAVNPARRPEEQGQGQGGVVISPKQGAGRKVGEQTRVTTQAVRREGRRLGETVWGPFVQASGVLWLEVTGVFFGLVALAGMDGMWLSRGALHWRQATGEVKAHFVMAAVLACVFAYFCLSSFLRAGRRGRGSSG